MVLIFTQSATSNSSSSSKQLGYSGRYRLVINIAKSLVLSAMIIGFYNIGLWLGSTGGELIETTHKSVVAKELESYDCFQPFPSPVLGEYKNWLINHNNNSGNYNNTAPKVLNAGFPKCGSTTLNEFLSQKISQDKQLSTIGYNVSHWRLNESNRKIKDNLVGPCMTNAVKNNNPPLSSCGNFAAYTQMDSESTSCNFPQISYLNEIYNEEPSAILLLPFRNVTEWIKSMETWHGLKKRLAKFCVFPEYNFTIEKGRKAKDEEFEELYCKHVKHIRKFAYFHI